jgi:hypothetical protein
MQVAPVNGFAVTRANSIQLLYTFTRLLIHRHYACRSYNFAGAPPRPRLELCMQVLSLLAIIALFIGLYKGYEWLCWVDEWEYTRQHRSGEEE